MKPLVISVVGPTAVGKSKLGVEIAKRFGGEVISGDSMQIYKSMDIGTAKVTEQEMQGIPHHLVDIKEPDESFSVAEFQNKVQSLIRTISSRGNVPVIVGGTGLYIQATLYNFNFSEEKRDEQVIKRLEKEASEYGMEALYQRLRSVDPEQAEKVHPNNERRVLRALEVYETTGKVMSDYQKQQSNESPFRPLILGLEMEREELYNRINRRVDQMVEEGLIAEVKRLYDKGYEHTQAMKAIGYKEFLPYFNGEYSLDRAVELLKRNSRRYAKRQYTYFRNKMNVRWYSISERGYEEKIETILNDLAGMMK
ncbi:tRNA (adenosine(37)-N6)-dimethylallyltransferase MiaA [Halobacillus sp. B29]|uniref:tRNA (adenosine(37)-N6)-dimethylallyltransferase MiaA n=1 Tax=Halobacillus sp. B29 TaxID=3457432 RepID=UPI003FCEBAA3